jgi:hypothetical protein
VLNKTAMVLYLSTDTSQKSKVTYALASDVANCLMITRPHMVDSVGMVSKFLQARNHSHSPLTP